MFEPKETELVEKMTFADRTYRSKRALSKFLATLSPEQLVETDVMMDDGLYVVFYPVANKPVTRHFDTSDPTEGRSAGAKLEAEILMGIPA